MCLAVIHSPSTTWSLAVSWNSVTSGLQRWANVFPTLIELTVQEKERGYAHTNWTTHWEEHTTNAINQILQGPTGEISSDSGLENTSWKFQHYSQSLHCGWVLDTWRWEERIWHRSPGLRSGRGSGGGVLVAEQQWVIHYSWSMMWMKQCSKTHSYKEMWVDHREPCMSKQKWLNFSYKKLGPNTTKVSVQGWGWSSTSHFLSFGWFICKMGLSYQPYLTTAWEDQSAWPQGSTALSKVWLSSRRAVSSSFGRTVSQKHLTCDISSLWQGQMGNLRQKMNTSKQNIF